MRVARRQDVVHAVARRTVGDGRVAALQRQAVEALDVGAEHVRRQLVLRDDALGRVALGARLGHVLRATPASAVSLTAAMLCSPWQSVQTGVSRTPCVQRLAVDAVDVGALDVLVALAARRRARSASRASTRGWSTCAGRATRGSRCRRRRSPRSSRAARCRARWPRSCRRGCPGAGGTSASRRRSRGTAPHVFVHVRAGDRRRRVARVEQRVGGAVAVLARRRLGDALVDGQAVVARQVDARLDAVALRARHRLRTESVGVRHLDDVGVADSCSGCGRGSTPRTSPRPRTATAACRPAVVVAKSLSPWQPKQSAFSRGGRAGARAATRAAAAPAAMTPSRARRNDAAQQPRSGADVRGSP